MEIRLLIQLAGVCILAFIVAEMFLTYPRECELKDHNGTIVKANCSEIYAKVH